MTEIVDSAGLLTGPSIDDYQPTRRGRAMVRAFLRERVGMAAAVITVLLLAYAVLVPLLASPASTNVAIDRKLIGPHFFSHGDWIYLGTDHLGRDLGVMVARGLRTSFEVGLTVIVITAVLGWLIGASGAYAGGWADAVAGRAMDALNVFPGVLVAVAIVSAIGGGLGIIILVLSIEGIVVFARLGRAIVLSDKHAEYVSACRSFGGGATRILFSHLARMSVPTILAVALVQLPQVILLEASLSFVGFGVQPPDTSIGLIVSEERVFVQVQAWPVLFSGGVLALTCVSLALVGLSARRVLSA
jgi:peptide/nickel transport system permease protein